MARNTFVNYIVQNLQQTLIFYIAVCCNDGYFIIFVFKINGDMGDVLLHFAMGDGGPHMTDRCECTCQLANGR